MLINWLIAKKVISEEAEELYKYAAQCLMISLYPFLLTIIIGICMGRLVESLLIIIPFMCIRKYSGGYHAKTMLICFIESCGLLILCIYLVSYVKCSMLLHVILATSMAVLWILSPIDSENRRLDLDEQKKYRTVARIIVTLFILVYLILYFVHKDVYAVSIALGLMLTAGMQLPCVYQRLKKKNM